MLGSAAAVLLVLIAPNTANEIGISSFPLMMAVAISVSVALRGPTGHSANVLIMDPGGFRFSNKRKVGIHLTLAALSVAAALLFIILSFSPYS